MPSPTLPIGTLYGFNPCFVLELTATPQDVQPRGGRNPREGRYANEFVEVTGRELDCEGMIKMPLNLDPRQGNGLEGNTQRRADQAQRTQCRCSEAPRRHGPLYPPDHANSGGAHRR